MKNPFTIFSRYAKQAKRIKDLEALNTELLKTQELQNRVIAIQDERLRLHEEFKQQANEEVEKRNKCISELVDHLRLDIFLLKCYETMLNASMEAGAKL
jgi:ABC-type phosphate transport system auxiliary subunit